MPGTLLLEDLNKANDDELAQHLQGLLAAPGGGFDPSHLIPSQLAVEPTAEPPPAPPQELQDHVQSLLSGGAPASAPAPTPPTPASSSPSGDVVQQLADHVGQATGLTWIGEGLTNLRQGAQQAVSGLANLRPPAPPASPQSGETTPGPQGPLQDYARQMAQRYGVDPDIFVRQIQQESGFRTDARSPAGATGIAQFMPDTARGLGIDPNDPYQALEGGARLMRQNLDRYGGDYRKALAAYNAGPGAVDRYGGVPPFEETQRYLSSILGGAGSRSAPTPAEGLTRAGQALGAANRDISQFGDSQLTNAQAYAACGPAAAVRFAQRFGRNPTLSEAVSMARTVGWTEDQGMAGLSSEKALMDKMGVPTKMVQGADWGTFANEARTGNPVTISTRGHYFTADGWDPQTNRFHVGRSGLDLKGGSEWMTPEQMTGLMGEVQGGLLADNPQAPGSTVATSPDATGAARGRARPLELLQDEGQTAAGFTAPGGPGRGFLEQAADTLGSGISRLGEAAQGGLTLLDDAVNATGTANPTPSSVPGGGYDPSALRAETTPPQEGVPLRQDVRDLGQAPQPTIFEPGGPIGEALGAIGEAPGLSEADRAARRQALEQTPLGQAYGSDLRKELLPNITEPNHPFNVMSELIDKYGAGPGGMPRVEQMTPEDQKRWQDAQLFVGGMAGPVGEAGQLGKAAGRVDLDALAQMRADARRAASQPPPAPPPGSAEHMDYLLGRGKWAPAETPQASALEKTMTVGVNNMLGGTTSFVNNALSGLAENVYRPVTTALVRGELGPAWQDVRAQGAAVGDALSDLASTFTTGQRASRLGGTDYPQSFPGKAGMLPFTEGNLRANAAMDEFNRALGMAGGQAAEMARLMREFPDVSQADLRARFADRLAEAGTNAAKVATFEAGGTPVGDALAAARRKFTSPDATVPERAAGLLTQLVVPFSKIPDVILTRGVLGAPGFAEARLGVNVAKAMKAGDAAGVQQAVRQWATTEAVNAAIAWQALQGNITGNGPTDPAKLAARENARDANGDPLWQKNSLRVPTPFGTRWIPYSSLGPIAVRLGGIANFVEQMDESEGKVDPNVFKEAVAATGETISDAWYLQTAGRIFQAMKTGKLTDVAGKTLLDFGERYVPDSALVNQFRQYTDPLVREPTNPLEDVANRIPGASQLVPPKINPATGEPLERPRDVLSAVTRSSAPGTPDPVNEALALHNLGVADPPPTITQKKFTVDINQAEQRQYAIEAGRAVAENVHKLIDDPEYQSWSYEDQRAALAKAVSDARADAAAIVWGNLSGDELDRRAAAYEERQRKAEEPTFRSPALAPR